MPLQYLCDCTVFNAQKQPVANVVRFSKCSNVPARGVVVVMVMMLVVMMVLMVMIGVMMVVVMVMMLVLIAETNCCQLWFVQMSQRWGSWCFFKCSQCCRWWLFQCHHAPCCRFFFYNVTTLLQGRGLYKLSMFNVAGGERNPGKFQELLPPRFHKPPSCSQGDLMIPNCTSSI